MSKVNLVLNVLLAAAVIYLFVNNAGTTASDADTAGSETLDTTASAPEKDMLVLAWVNIDSVSNNYKEIADLSKVINEKEDQYTRKLEAMYGSLQKKGDEFQRKYQMGGWTESEAQAKSKELEQEAAYLQRFEQEEGRKLQIEASDLQLKLMNTLSDYVDRYAAENGIDYVFGKNFGVNVFLSVSYTHLTLPTIA